MELGVVIRSVLISAVSALVIHEAGHFIIARLFGYKARFVNGHVEIGGLSIWQPVVYVDKPMTPTARRAFGIGGFAFEFIAGSLLAVAALFWGGDWQIMSVTYIIVATLHLIAYPFYNANSSANDFRTVIGWK